MQNPIRLSAWCALLISLSVSCQNTHTSIPIPSATPGVQPNRWDSWLTQPACQPPCWQNITPGLTTIGEAISSLESTPGITITFRSDNGVDWVFNQNEKEGGTLGTSQDGIVNMIWLGSVSDRKLFVETIVASYDEPEYVKPYDCREGMCSTALAYPDLGMFLSVFIENTGKDSNSPQIEILPNTIVNRVYFIEAGIDSFRSSPGFEDLATLMEWKGYGDYP